MSEENHPVPPPPRPEDGIPWKIIWLVVAFLPAVVGICTLDKHGGDSGGQGLTVFLFILNMICVVAAGIGLGKGMDSGTRLILVFCLSPILFVVNVIIVLFVGCSQGGGIA